MDTLNHNLSVDNIIELAFTQAMEAAEAVTRESNGSEAWQAVQFNTKGLRKLQNQLKKIDGIRHDSYWGYIHTAPLYNYYQEEAYTDKYVQVLRGYRISAQRVERLL